MAGSAPRAFRIDVATNRLLLHSAVHPPAPLEHKGTALPDPAFPAIPGTTLCPWTGHGFRKAPMEARTSHAQGARLVGSVHSHARRAGDFPPITAQTHCFSTLNHSLGWNDAPVIKSLWPALRGLKGGGPQFRGLAQ